MNAEPDGTSRVPLKTFLTMTDLFARQLLQAPAGTKFIWLPVKKRPVRKNAKWRLWPPWVTHDVLNDISTRGKCLRCDGHKRGPGKAAGSPPDRKAKNMNKALIDIRNPDIEDGWEWCVFKLRSRLNRKSRLGSKTRGGSPPGGTRVNDSPPPWGPQDPKGR